MDWYSYISWKLGEISVVLVLAMTTFAVGFWLKEERKGALFEMSTWLDVTLERIAMTYCYFLSALLLTAVSIAYVFQSQPIMKQMVLHSESIVFLTILQMSILTAWLESIPYSSSNHVLKNFIWFSHSTTPGPSLAFFGSHICNMSALWMFFGYCLATLVGFASPKSLYLGMEPYLKFMYSLVGATSLLCFIFNPPTTALGVVFMSLNLFGGIILYFGVLVVNTQILIRDALSSDSFDPIYTAAVIYLCAINLFLRIAMCYVVELTNITDPTYS